MRLDRECSHGELFGSVLTTDSMAAATSDRSWVRAMLEFEAALAAVEADAGLIPPPALDAIKGATADPEDFDALVLGREGRLSGNPAVALVSELRRRVPEEAARWVHFGATSQDVVDTAMMLVLRESLDLVIGDAVRAAAAAAVLAERYRSAPMVARTLLQQALPTTFGRKAAGWLVALLEAFEALSQVRRHRLAIQLGGAAGTLSELGALGPAVAERLASKLEMAVPVLPWHTDRTRVAEAAGALAISAGAVGKIALDVSLLMQNEVAEAAEPPAAGRGASSSMTHKRNPAMAAVVLASWHRARGLHAVVLGTMAQEHERAVGAWQAEPETISELCRAVGGAVSVTADILEGMEVVTERMAKNLEVATRAGEGTGNAEAFVDRALAFYRERLAGG